MATEVKKCIINDSIYNVIDYDTFNKNPMIYGDDTAILEQDKIYPIITKAMEMNSGKPGFVVGESKSIGFFVEPEGEDKEKYSSENIIDFSSNSFKDVIEKAEILYEKEKSILTNAENIFEPRIKESDTSFMVGMKESVIAKQFDWENYEHRFGGNSNNCKNIFEKSDITIKKALEICNNLDIELSVTFKDKDSDIANPMNTTITKVLTN